MHPAVPTLAFALLIAAAPAAGQIVINGSRQADAAQLERPVPIMRGQGYRGDLRRIDRRIRRARDNGEMGRCEARSLRRQVAAIRSTAASYASGGLSDAELATLELQIFALRDAWRAPARPLPPDCRSR